LNIRRWGVLEVVVVALFLMVMLAPWVTVR